MLYQRPEFTQWAVEVVEDKINDKSLYDHVFRTTIRDGVECEQFTLLERGSDNALIQLRMFKGGEVTSETWVPACVRVATRRKRIAVTFLEPLSRLDPAELKRIEEIERQNEESFERFKQPLQKRSRQ